MKLIFPILICSAISAALGYYFGHITIPVGTEQVAASPTASQPAPAPAPAPAPVQPQYVEPAPMPEPEPIAEPEPEEALAVTPEPTESSFAERAAATTQTFTDTQGRTIEASIVEVTDREVKIRRTDGLRTQIPLNMLSAEDAAFCNYLREQAAKKEKESKPATSDGFDWDAYFNS